MKYVTLFIILLLQPSFADAPKSDPDFINYYYVPENDPVWGAYALLMIRESGEVRFLYFAGPSKKFHVSDQWVKCLFKSLRKKEITKLNNNGPSMNGAPVRELSGRIDGVEFRFTPKNSEIIPPKIHDAIMKFAKRVKNTDEEE